MEIKEDINSRIITRLQDWDKKEGPLPGVIRFFNELTVIQSDVQPEAVLPIPLKPEGWISDRIHQGIPLLSAEDFQLDWQEVQKVFEQVAKWTAKDDLAYPEENKILKDIGCNPELLKTIFKRWYRQVPITGIPEAEGIDIDLLTSVFAAVFKPFLSVYARQLLPAINQEQWCRQCCPICGGKPDFSYIEREKGARWLLCSRCDAEWLFIRLACPFCGSRDERGLSYYTDEEGSNYYRIYLCKHCETYLKAIDLRQARSEVLLPLERLMTLDLDRQAQDMGFRPGHLSKALSALA